MSVTTKNTKDAKRELPPGWRWVRLGEVCESRTGIRDPKATPEVSFQYVDIASVDNIRKRIAIVQTIQGKDAPSRARQVIRTNDVLVATTRPNLNAVALVPQELDNQICSTGFCVLRTNRQAAPDYLFAFVRHTGFVDSLTDLVKGALYPAVNDGQVLLQLLPLPPLPEQRRIAAILKEQMAAVDKARAAAEARLAAVKALPAAFLREVFPRAGAPLPTGWKVAKIGDVATLQGGYAFKSAWFVDKGIRLLRNANIFQNFIDWTDVVSLPLQRRSEFGEYELNEGDIVLALDRPVVAAGLKVARISKDDTPALLLQRVARFKVKAGFSADYLYGFLHTEAFKAAITAHDQSLGVPHVSPSQVESVVIPVPSLAEQRRLAASLREQMASAEQARASAEAELAAINALPAALLRRAFNGEL